MIIKLEINGTEKDVKIKGITPAHQDEYYKKVSNLDKVESDENTSLEDKLAKANDLVKWLFNTGLKKSDLNDEEKKLVEEDLEERKKIVEAIREILQPVSSAKKK